MNRPEILNELSGEIDSHVDRATKIINHMRQFGRKSDPKLDEIQINDVLEKSFEIFSQQLVVRGIEVAWEIAENLPLILADAGRLEQVFINLLINARDAIEDKWESNSPQKGDKKITLKSRSEGGRVFVEVQDTGGGIAAEDLPYVFERFYRSDRSRSRASAEEGTGGLGLAIVRSIVNAHGGQVSIDSQEGKGTTVRFTLPVYLD